MNPAGAAVLAAAGGPGVMIKIDPMTGEREEFHGARAGAIPLGSVTVPVPALRAAVTGAPPPFSELVSARKRKNGLYEARVMEPGMTIYYSDRLTALVIEGDGGGEISIEPGPMAPGPLAPYASSARIEAQGAGAVDIRWISVRQGISFPEGFFSFEEPIE